MAVRIEMTFDLSLKAATRLTKGLTGDDQDLVLCMEKTLAALLGVEAGADVVADVDQGSLDAELNIGLMEEGYDAGSWELDINAFAVEDAIKDLVKA